jgi:hypothetical protein
MCSASHAAYNIGVFKLKDAMNLPAVRAITSQEIRFFLDESELPDYVERTEADDYQRTGRKYPSGQPDICDEAFVHVIKKLKDFAVEHHYDVVLIAGADGYGAPLGAGEYGCKPGAQTEDVRLFVQFIVTRAYAERLDANAAAAEKEAGWRPRNTKEEFLSLSIADALKNPVVQAAIDPAIKMHFGRANPPAYSLRTRPSRFSGNVTIEHDKESACQEAFAGAIRDMIDDVKEDGFNAAINIRSNWENRYARSDEEYECRIERHDADVALSAVFVKLK